MKQRILVLGYFGYKDNLLDGQIIKTRNIFELLQLKSEVYKKIEIFDTHLLKYSNFFFLNMLWKILICNKLVYLPAQNNLKYLFPIIYLLCWLKRCEILYIVVGGWLGEFIKSKRLHRVLLSNIRVILPESDYMRISLITQYGFKNVITFPNFRIHSYIPTLVQNRDQFRIVFMARINKMKGLDYIFNLAEYFSTLSLATRPFSIDFYGPIESADESYFFEQIAKHKQINYRGILQPEDIYKTLNIYDVMVLPTRFFTEGFPGTVLDAYIAGIPVIATRWKHAADFIIQDKTGIIIPFENSQKDFNDAVFKLYNDAGLLKQMKHNAYLQSQQYSSKVAWEILIANNLVNTNK